MTGEKRETIVHVIDSLIRGGAESMLLSLVKELGKEYDIILVTLSDINDFDEVRVKKHYCLQRKSVYEFPLLAWKLRTIINRHKPVLVRAQLYWSTIVARLATPRSIPLIFSIHSFMSDDSFLKNPLSLRLERLTYRKSNVLLSVSQAALDDYKKYVPVTGPTVVLNNFTDPAFFEQTKEFTPVPDKLRLIAVGNLKDVKNHAILLEAIALVHPRAHLTLAIAGEGDLRASMEQRIAETGIPVTLLGNQRNIPHLLPGYDVFISSSKSEGFGIALTEAMAVGLPLVLNDLPVFREVTRGCALFYAQNDKQSLATLLLSLNERREELRALAVQGKKIAADYSREAYVRQLSALYDSIKRRPGQTPQPASRSKAASHHE
jgi:glycosyltransferase involved in cell wall biosynthesis